MKVNITEIKAKVKMAGEKKNHPNILASGSITV